MTGAEIVDALKPEIGTYILLAVGFVASLLLKDIFTTLTYGLMFYFDPSFKEGDFVLLDNERALIIKIGIRKTCFEIEQDGNTYWRYIPNDKIRYTKLEKIIREKQ